MTDPNYDNYSIIPFNGLTRVLFLREDASWTLPRHHGDTAEEINAAMREQFGLTTTVLSCVYDRYQDAERADQHRVYALENHSPYAPLPANGRLIERAELDNLPLTVADHRGVLEAWFAEAGSEEPFRKRLPWMRPGWFAIATAWIDEQMTRLGSLYRALFWYSYLDQLEPELRWMHWDAAFYFLQVFLGTEE